MNETIKMTNGELNEIRELQEKFEQKVFQFGQLYLKRIQSEQSIKDIGEQETRLKDEWRNLQKLENELIEKFLKKYGEGNLDLNKGVFVSNKTSMEVS